MRLFFVLICAAALSACQRIEEKAPPPEGEAVSADESVTEGSIFPAVDAALLSAPNGAFTALEPSVFGVFGAPSIEEALGEIIASTEDSEGELHLSIVESGETAVANIVRTNVGDDAIAAAHIRIEFRREPAEGWYPVNAFRRQQCRRGELAGQWSAAPCP